MRSNKDRSTPNERVHQVLPPGINKDVAILSTDPISRKASIMLGPNLPRLSVPLVDPSLSPE